MKFVFVPLTSRGLVRFAMEIAAGISIRAAMMADGFSEPAARSFGVVALIITFFIMRWALPDAERPT